MRGDLRPGAHARRRGRGPEGARGRAGRLQPGVPVPEGHVAARAARGPRPAAHAARQGPRRRSPRGRAGRRRSRRSTAACRRSMAEHGRDAVAVYNGNPTAHNLAALLYGRLLLKALGTKNLFSASTVDQQPKQLAVAHLFGTGLSRAAPRPRPHRPPARARRQPDGLEREPHDGPRRAPAPARDPRARRADRRRRPAPHAHGAGGRRARRHPARGPTPSSCWRWCTCSSPRTSSTSATPRPTSRASRRCASSRSAAPRRTPRSAAGSRRTRSAGSPATSPPPTAASSTAGSARRRSASAPPPAGSSTSSTRSRATSTGPAARCSRRPPRASGTRRARPGAAGGRGPRGTRAACAASPRSSASCPWPRWPRRSRRLAPARCAPC